MKTPIQYLGIEYGNKLYVKREDLIPFSFGGNKVRKADLFFKEFDNGKYDCVVTYGSSSSNHCRVVSNMASVRNIPCLIISPKEASKPTYNSQMMELFGAEIVTVSVSQVHETIEDKMNSLREKDLKPYFIPGGGHGNIGTQAYVNCYNEIVVQEESKGIHFEYIFLASGTGTTQAGLVCGQLMKIDERKIIGISVARKNPRGREIVIESIKEFLPEASEKCIQENTIFIDDYSGVGYGVESTEINDTIKAVMKQYGIPLDSTYTGKAFHGMRGFLEQKGISGKNVLFIHTGGTPLFFDTLREINEVVK